MGHVKQNLGKILKTIFALLIVEQLSTTKMGKNKLCIVCGSALRLEAQKDPAFGVGARSEISGRTIKDMISGIFLSDEELQYILGRPPQLDSQQVGGHQNSFMTGVFPSNPEYGPGVCSTCFNLLEQIEAFEMNLNR